MCVNCDFKELKKYSCIFCKDTDAFKEYKIERGRLCPGCKKWICDDCISMTRFIDLGDKFYGCMNCLLDKSKFLDVIRERVAENIKRDPMVFKSW